MHNFLLYLFKSTLCISLLYMLFRIIMRKESFFAMNRILLLIIVIASTIIPLLYLPKIYQPPVQVELLPVFVPVKTSPATLPAMETSVAGSISVPGNPIPKIKSENLVFTVQQLLQYGYLAGFFVTLLFLVYSLIAILLLYRKSRAIKMDGYRLLIIDREIAAFSFGRLVVLSQKDYEEHRQTMLAHEQAHIRLYHFFDLLLLETIRIFHWFNPFIHWLIRDMKEIHEFQADDYTLTKGIDEIQYKLLIIQKGVGSQMFALANSFNHCQIKKRLVMMNKEKPSKAWSWKVATFLPLLALLLMAFGRKAENKPPGGTGLSPIAQVVSKDSTKQWSEADFKSPRDYTTWIGPDFGYITKDGKLGYITKDGKTVTLQKSNSSVFKYWNVQIDSRSQIWTGNHSRPLNWHEFQDSIRTYFDYDFATERTKPYFQKWRIDGIETMTPHRFFEIVCDQSTPAIDYQKFLNAIGNTILEIRLKYSMKIYKKDYSRLTPGQRGQIDTTIPLIAGFYKTPVTRQEVTFRMDSLSKASKQKEKYEVIQADKFVLNREKPSVMYLYNAQVKFNDWKLTAGYIEINQDSNWIYATGTTDSTGAIVGEFVLTFGNQMIKGDQIKCNFMTKRFMTSKSGKISKF